MPLMSRMQSRAARSLTTSTADAGAGNGTPSHPAPKFVDNAPPPSVGYGGSRFTTIQTGSGGGIPAASYGLGSFIPPAASQSRFSQPITRPLPRPARPPSPPVNEDDESSPFLHQIQLDTNQAGIVIGKGGVTIHRIEHESGAKMRTLPAGSGGARQLEISSDNPQFVDKAVQMVMEQLESFGRPLGSSGGQHQSNPAATPSLPIPPPPNSTGPATAPGFDTRKKEPHHYQPAAESEARIVDYVSMPSGSAFEFSPSDLAKFKKKLGVRIHQLDDRRLTINGPEGKVMEAKRHLESFLTEEAARQQPAMEPRVVVDGDTIIERASNADAMLEQLDSEMADQQPELQTEPRMELVQAANATPQTPHDSGNSSDEEVATTESGVGASGREESGGAEEGQDSFWTPETVIAEDGFDQLDELVQVASDPDASSASLIPSSLEQLMQSIGEMTEELGGLRAEVAELRKTHRRDSETASATADELKQAMETVTSLRADVKKLHEAKVEEQLPKSPICAVCNTRMCKVLASVGNIIICSTRCSECPE